MKLLKLASKSDWFMSCHGSGELLPFCVCVCVCVCVNDRSSVYISYPIRNSIYMQWQWGYPSSRYMHPATDWFSFICSLIYIYIYTQQPRPPNANHSFIQSFIHSFMIIHLLYVATSAHFPISFQKTKQNKKKGGQAPFYTSKQKPIHFVIYSTKVHI